MAKEEIFRMIPTIVIYLMIFTRRKSSRNARANRRPKLTERYGDRNRRALHRCHIPVTRLPGLRILLEAVPCDSRPC